VGFRQWTRTSGEPCLYSVHAFCSQLGFPLSSLAGLAVAETGVATTPESSVATTPESSVATTPETAAVEILAPDESWGGLTRGEWDARAWQCSVSQPDSVDPSLLTTDTGCGFGQSGPVFFLRRSGAVPCVVAEGTAIVVKVAGSECSTVEPPPYFGRTEDELRACATASVSDEVTDLQARVNGQEVADLDAYLTTSPLFTLTFPEANRYGVEPGVAQSVSAAYSFIIAPPPPVSTRSSPRRRTPGSRFPTRSTSSSKPPR
jgi:hypothetical protein